MRDQIYAILFTNGHLDILRTSKAVNADAAISFERAASFKVKLDMSLLYTLHCRPFTPPSVPINKIRNVEVQLQMIEDLASYPNVCFWISQPRGEEERQKQLNKARMKLVTLLLTRTEQRVLRIILKEFDTNGWHAIATQHFDWIPEGGSLKVVSVTALASQTSKSSLSGPNEPHTELVMRARNRCMYDVVKRILAPKLGPSTWHDGTLAEERYLKFEPQKHKGADGA